MANATNVTGTGVVRTGPCIYRGFWLNSGAAQTVTIYDGTSASGTVLAQFTAAGAGEAFHEDVKISCAYGIYLHVSAGSVAGSIRH